MTIHIQHETVPLSIETQLEIDQRRYDAAMDRQQSNKERGGLVGNVLSSFYGLGARVLGLYVDETQGLMDAEDNKALGDNRHAV
jgi:hypothetical protein